MGIPTFERSLDLLLDNDFSLNDEEIDHLYQLVMSDEVLFSNINKLVNSIDPTALDIEKLRSTIKKALHNDNTSVELLYEKIIGHKEVISYIQEIILKRFLD
jgi:hypothetical protein